MASKNKFGFDDLTPDKAPRPRKRNLGPMGAAVRDAAENLTETTNVKMEQRKQNATDAKAYRRAQEAGLVLVNLELDAVKTDDLPRDRLDLGDVAKSNEMEELMASIAARGQREPIEVYSDGAGGYQLKKGWRRLTALRQLLAKTGDDAFATVTARIAQSSEERVAQYIDMVEENIIREDLTFAEMAQLAITAAQDPALGLATTDAAVARLYSSLHKMKRSYIRSFIYLLETLGEAVDWPKAISRNLGVDVARKLRAEPARLPELISALDRCLNKDEQTAAFQGFVAADGVKPVGDKRPVAPKQKFEFHVGEMKVTARNGELRIVEGRDFTGVPKADLERAVHALADVLSKG
ncbi:chromosome partitioning protein ParB [Amylibacter marinus]|uniref:Chromosome partitioning protein ParB n=1 Tax=Amylibacter marinus TaxID=1475483 RepID=A0ABQ5VY14_9RHOB|nr:ParB N-terminal domain-containing protein [Amylibacter marinus]GLQ35983.1 chromosome partitioning protein ParB [Amylibacter marinus]